MTSRWLATGCLLAAVIVVLAAAPEAQGPAASGASKPAARSAWTPHRTPWGDPDLQGNFTNKDEQGVPFERPAEFAGRSVVSDEEFAAREAQLRQQLATDNAEFDQATADTSNAGAVGSATSPPPHWLDRGKPSRRTSRIVDPPDGRIPTMTAEGQKRAAARPAPRRFGDRAPASYLDGGLYDRCITRGLPGSMMPAIYGNAYQIVQGPGYVAIRYEMIHETRVIPLENRQHVAPAIRSYMGDARGHWEGPTLVVETTNFKPENAYQGANASALRLIERFTPVGENKLEWSVTVDDATTWTRPWTFEIDLTRDANQPVMEYACHEGNYAMSNILSGARSAEK
jgi:hypothetical protein